MSIYQSKVNWNCRPLLYAQHSPLSRISPSRLFFCYWSCKTLTCLRSSIHPSMFDRGYYIQQDMFHHLQDLDRKIHYTTSTKILEANSFLTLPASKQNSHDRVSTNSKKTPPTRSLRLVVWLNPSPEDRQIAINRLPWVHYVEVRASHP